MENIIVMYENDFVRLINDERIDAAIEVVNDHIKPHNAAKARRLISSLKESVSKNRKKQTSKPQEVVIRALNLAPESYKNIEQYIARKA